MLRHELTVCPSTASGWGLVTRKTRHRKRGLGSPREWRGLETEFYHMVNDLINESCQQNEIPVKTVELHGW